MLLNSLNKIYLNFKTIHQNSGPVFKRGKNLVDLKNYQFSDYLQYDTKHNVVFYCFKNVILEGKPSHNF